MPFDCSYGITTPSGLQRSSDMDLLENLEVFIPANAKVKIVPLRSLPTSVQRRMGSLPSSSWQPVDSLEGVWICPAHLRGRGQRSVTRTGEGEEDAKQLVWQRSQVLTGPVRMSFVTANRSAYNVLSSGMLPRRAVSAAAAAAAAGCAAKTHQDAIVVYRSRIYLAIKRRPGCHQSGPPLDRAASDIAFSSERSAKSHKVRNVFCYGKLEQRETISNAGKNGSIKQSKLCAWI